MDLFNATPTEDNPRSQALYRKWRSQTFGELVGQEHIVRTLQNALSSGRIAHAYLFTGPRGTGKTSTARLLAKAVNCLNYSPEAVAAGQPIPCGECDNCRAITEGRALDLVEIDAASNTGVDDVRVLRDGVNFSPSVFRYRVYIIDEVHMLSVAAFNALLKTLEEPPAHAIFILATTEAHKIPATVLSRVQRHDFRRIPLGEMVSRLTYICEQEGISVEPAALELIARSATGSLRDAESITDQLIAYSGSHITLAATQAMLGASGSEQVVAFVDDLIARDLGSGLERINALLDSGVDMRQFNRQLVEYLRNLMLLKAGGEEIASLDVTAEAMNRLKEQAAHASLSLLVSWLKTFSAADNALRLTPYGQLPLEVAFVEATLADGTEARPAEARPPARAYQPTTAAPTPAPARPQPVTPPTREPVGAQFIAPTPAPIQPPPVAPTSVPITSTDSEVEQLPTMSFEGVEARWKDVRERVGAKSKSIEALLRDCPPYGVDGNVILLRPRYSFHKTKIEQAETRSVVEEVLSRMFGNGQRIQIRCLTSEQEEREAKLGNAEAPMTTVRRDERVQAATNIFNGTIREVR